MATPSDFDTAFYLAQNPDVAAAIASGQFGSALDHFNRYGVSENRAPNATILNAATGQGRAAVGSDAYNFNMNNPVGGLLDDWGADYLAANPDVLAAVRGGQFGSALDHFTKTGKAEGRSWGSGYTVANNPATGAPTYGGPAYAGTKALADSITAAQPSQPTQPTKTGGLGGLGGVDLSAQYQQMMQQMFQNQTDMMSSWQKSLGAGFGKTYNPTGTGGSFSNVNSPVYRPGGQTDTGMQAANGWGGSWSNGPFKAAF